MPNPSKFEPRFLKLALKLARLGATDVQMADAFEVSKDTFYEWKKVHPEFVRALRKGKDEADAQVANSLFRRATGYKHKAVKIFCSKDGAITKEPYIERFAPDVVACIFWLKNRQRALWRDRVDTEVTGKDGAALEAPMDDRELARRIAYVLSQEVLRKATH